MSIPLVTFDSALWALAGQRDVELLSA